MHFSLHDKKQYTSQQKKRYKGLTRLSKLNRTNMWKQYQEKSFIVSMIGLASFCRYMKYSSISKI
jgi:hypothetical protein